MDVESREEEKMAKEYEYLNWSDQDWIDYQNTQAPVPLPLLEKLKDAASLLSQGKRPNKEGREHWGQVADQAKRIYYFNTEQFGV